MDIGIMTYYGDNFGAVLQAYSVSDTLKVLNPDCNVDVIRYNAPFMRGRYNLFDHKFNTLRGAISNLIRLPQKALLKFKFYQFKKKYINFSSKVYNEHSIKDDYDVYFTGSDQVWNFHMNKGDTNYILGFVGDNRKKYSFAASIADDDYIEYDNIYKEYLKYFTFISIRENRFIPYVRKYNSNVICSLDPVFLKTGDEWRKMIGLRMVKKNYILIYSFVALGENLSKVIYDYSVRLNYDIYVIGSFPKSYQKIFHRISSCGPIDFLNYINFASIVITDSFHGTSFSIILEKDFYSIRREYRFSRIDDLLQELNLSDRIINDLGENFKEYSIQYNAVKEIIELKRKESIDYLTACSKQWNK